MERYTNIGWNIKGKTVIEPRKRRLDTFHCMSEVSTHVYQCKKWLRPKNFILVEIHNLNSEQEYFKIIHNGRKFICSAALKWKDIPYHIEGLGSITLMISVATFPVGTEYQEIVDNLTVQPELTIQYVEHKTKIDIPYTDFLNKRITDFFAQERNREALEFLKSHLKETRLDIHKVEEALQGNSSLVVGEWSIEKWSLDDNVIWLYKPLEWKPKYSKWMFRMKIRPYYHYHQNDPTEQIIGKKRTISKV